jgi:hypothetical protein
MQSVFRGATGEPGGTSRRIDNYDDTKYWREADQAMF